MDRYTCYEITSEYESRTKVRSVRLSLSLSLSFPRPPHAPSVDLCVLDTLPNQAEVVKLQANGRVDGLGSGVQSWRAECRLGNLYFYPQKIRRKSAISGALPTGTNSIPDKSGARAHKKMLPWRQGAYNGGGGGGGYGRLPPPYGQQYSALIGNESVQMSSLMHYDDVLPSDAAFASPAYHPTRPSSKSSLIQMRDAYIRAAIHEKMSADAGFHALGAPGCPTRSRGQPALAGGCNDAGHHDRPDAAAV